MKLARQLALVLFLGAAQAWAGISYVGGACAEASTNVSSLQVNYSPAAAPGSKILCFLNNNASTSLASCKDSSSNSLAALGTNSATNFAYSFGYSAVAGITSFTAAWTTTRNATVCVLEYAVSGGTITFAAVCTAQSSGSTGWTCPASGNYPANAWCVGIIGDTTTTPVTSGTTTAGNFRVGTTAGSARAGVGDNSNGASPGALSFNSSATPTTWLILAEELTFTPNSSPSLLPLMGVGG